MKVFDCVMVNKEPDLDLLQARFTEYADIPEVIHVIAEAVADHYGSPKPLWFWESPLAGQWRGKWNHVRVEASELPAGASPKIRKDALREYLAHGVAGESEDIVLHGAIDEIPARWVIAELLEGKIQLPAALQMRWCAYTPELVHPLPWKGTVAQWWQMTGSFSGLRERRTDLPSVLDAGTRLSMMNEEPRDKHPDGHALWDAEIDDTYPRWVQGRL